MPITTYRNDKSTFINDKDINEYLSKNWYVEKREIKKRFKKPYFVYQLLFDFSGDSMEYQIINFWADENNSSINTWVFKEIIMAFLMGLSDKDKNLSKEKKDILIVASGFFDPLHIGHIEYLKLAKALGDKLIVILNNDEQAQLKKGKVFMPLAERKIILESLSIVDEVFISIDKDKTVCKSLEYLKPNIFAKGGDRKIDNIPEAEICKKLGIKIVDGLGEKIQSSSNLIKNK